MDNVRDLTPTQTVSLGDMQRQQQPADAGVNINAINGLTGAAEETPKRKYPRGDKMSPNDFLLWKMLLGIQKDYYRRPTVRPDGSIETEAEVIARMQERFPEEFYLEMGDTEFKDFMHDARTGQVRFG